jgi:hypothetical protein
MTNEEAVRKGLHLWGLRAVLNYNFNRIPHYEVGVIEVFGHETKAGWFEHGTGNTWEEAFASASASKTSNEGGR